MTTELDASTADIDAALEAAGTGARLDAGAVESLLGARGPRLERLLEMASQRRDEGLNLAGRPGIFTYSRKAFLPLTTLCRDRCHYCTFVDTPAQLKRRQQPLYMSEEQVLSVARQAAALDCKEALLTLGDRPESRWPEARAWLEKRGFDSTLEYMGHIAKLVTAETGMLAHLNPGVMSYEELKRLRSTAPSMGMMLETTSRRLFEEPGQVHFGSPDKDPEKRLKVLKDAGRARVPFTTGILVGIGETLRDRAESLVVLKDLHQRHGHLQEVIVQNFRAKTGTAGRGRPDLEALDYITTVAVARIVLGSRIRVQVPPNLSDPEVLKLLVRAGADDWGGVSPLTADHVNPERPWPQISDLKARTAVLGFELVERLTVHPEYIPEARGWIDPALRSAVNALVDTVTGLARRTGEGSHEIVRRPSAIEPVVQEPVVSRVGSALRPMKLASGVPALAERAAADPNGLESGEWVALLTSTGQDLDHLTSVADGVRRFTAGEVVGIVVNRNLTTSGYVGRATASAPEQFCHDDVARIVDDAVQLGATELCVQGIVPPSEDAAAYVEIVRAARRAAPGIHLHAYRPQDVCDFADRKGLDVEEAVRVLREAGVDTIPGTGVKILSERVRRLVAPGDLALERWREVIHAAHRAGLRSTSLLFYGHVETAAERIEHLSELRAIQVDATAAGTGGGFTEFIPIPLPIPAGGGVPLVPGRAPLDEHRAMVAVSRLLLSGSIPNVQIPWTRVGKGTAAALLQCGGNDLGGTLLDGRVLPEAGVECGLELPLAEAAKIGGMIGRPLRQRTTSYQTVRMIAVPSRAGRAP